MPLFGLEVSVSMPSPNISLSLPQSFTDAVEDIPKQLKADRYQKMRIYLDAKSLSEGEKYGLIHNWERIYDLCNIYNMENRNDGIRLNDGVFNYMLISAMLGNGTMQERLYHLSQDDPFIYNKLLNDRNFWFNNLKDPDPITKELLEKLNIGWVMVTPKFRQ